VPYDGPLKMPKKNSSAVCSSKMLRSGFELHQPPVSALQAFMTPLADMFYVSHLGVADMFAKPWSLEIGGLVEKPATFTWAELQELPVRRVIAAHECAGSPLFPTKPVRRVGNVEWQGVSLGSVLAIAGVLPQARYLWSTGADSGSFNGVEHPNYQKDLPIEKAQAGETLIATHINGEPLSPERGGPARLIVPGFYGTNSTKWLRRLELREDRSPGYFTTTLYNDRVESGGRTHLKPVWAIAPHSLIVSHEDGASVAAGSQDIKGWAWAGAGIAQVEVSVDAGASWRLARLERRVDFSWQGFSLEANLPPGAHRLFCRATANDGAVQPASGARNEWFAIRIEALAAP
jgi:DMSO/TMAO reductase YedYZ molybdopterin-dependent catalytic subunit